MDLSTHKCLEDIEKLDPENLEYLDQNFTIYLADSSEYTLKPNGRTIKLTQNNKEEYIYLAKKAYLASFLPQFEKIKEGFYSLLSAAMLKNITSE